MRRYRGRALLGAALAVVLLAGACSSDDDDTSTTDTTAAEATSEVTPGPGFDGTTIKLGVLTPQTGLAEAIGTPLTAGNQAYFDRINAEGGIAGKYPVELTVRDTEYQAPVAVTQYGDIKSNVAMFVQVLGTAIQDAILPQLKTDGIFAGPATLDAFWVREPNLMPIGAPYQIQAINGLDYAVNNLDAEDKTICAMVEDSPYGEAGLEGLEYAADEYGVEISEVQNFRLGDPSYTAQVNALSGAGCELVWLTSLPTTTIPLMTESNGVGFAPTWLANSPAWNALLAVGDLATYMADNFLLMAEGPEWGDTSVEGMAQMLEDIAAYAPNQVPNIYFAFGYAQAWAAAQILEKAVELGDLSPSGIIAASEEVGTLTFGGLLGDYAYGPVEDRDPPRGTTVNAVDPTSTDTGFLVALEVDLISDAAKNYEFDD
jgi:ABC-type branched-subunit amino acid transport system substrate-binding protein